MPALDGVRACAVLGVVAIHGGAHIQGGFIGVDIFFVLSGFLITSLLLQEWGVRGAIDLRGFYVRRVRRLLPALIVTLVGVTLLVVLFPWFYDGAVRFPLALISVVFYSSNWVSALEQGNHIGPLTHTWSLAIEEQFYLLWPITLLLFLRRGTKPRNLLAALLLLIAASGIERGLLWTFSAGGDPYYRTDTHADGILLGCALGIARNWASTQSFFVSLLRPVGVAVTACATLLACALSVDLTSPFLYRGGYLVVAIAAAALVGHTVCAQDSIVSRMLAQRVLRWIGERSYGLYLYHLPIFLLLTKQRLHSSTPATFAIDLAIALAVTAVSYRFVELPFLRKRRATEPASPGARTEVSRRAEPQSSQQIEPLPVEATNPAMDG